MSFLTSKSVFRASTCMQVLKPPFKRLGENRHYNGPPDFNLLPGSRKWSTWNHNRAILMDYLPDCPGKELLGEQSIENQQHQSSREQAAETKKKFLQLSISTGRRHKREVWMGKCTLAFHGPHYSRWPGYRAPWKRFVETVLFTHTQLKTLKKLFHNLF